MTGRANGARCSGEGPRVREFASEPLVRRLIDWGIDTVFGRPGDGPEGVERAFQRHQDEIRLLTVEHEEAAGLMACGYAKATGRIGVCLATSGPGAIHLLNGLYDAKLDHQPVLAITESPRTHLLGTGFDQDVCLDKVLADVADYNARVHVPVQIPAMVDIGIGNAVARGSVSHITFPWSLEPAAAESGPWMATTASAPPTAPVFVAAPGVPATVELERAAAVLNEGGRVAMLIGVGATGATNELLAVAEVLGSPIVKSLPGKPVVPDDHPLTTGCAGALGTRPSQEALRAADTLLVVGSNYPYQRDAADPETLTAVHLDTDLARISSRGPNDVPLVGDPVETLQALLPLLRRRQDRGFLVSASLGGMPTGLPDAIAAQLSQPDRQCIALVGSDGFTKLMAELLTVAEHRLPVKVLLADTSMAPNFAFWADACGVLGLRVEAATQLEEAVGRAFDHDGPVLVDVLVDPAEQPVPALAASA